MVNIGPGYNPRMSDCLFCQILEGRVPARIVHQDEAAVAFEDINPQAPTHVLVVPRKHIASLDAAGAEDAALIGHLHLVAAKIAAERKITRGYRTLFNNGPMSGQSVFHLHLHVLGGRPMHWPPG
jgi:histidine triad (HIT) family protein